MEYTLEDCVGLKAAANILKLSESAVRYLVLKGDLKPLRDDSNRKRFPLPELRTLARKRASAKRAAAR